MPADLPSSSAAKLRWRWLVAVAVAVVPVWFLCFWFPVSWDVMGIGESGRPFLDLYGLLAAFDGRQQGLNPFLPSPLDPSQRAHIYSSWWFALGDLGLGRKDIIWLGIVLGIFLLLIALVAVRPRGWRDSLGLFLLLVSPAFLLAVNRANNDLLILLPLALGLACFRSERTPWRAAGVLLFALAAVLKYYPLVTLLLLLDARNRRELAAGLGLYLLVLAVAWPGLKPGLEAASKYGPVPSWLYAFGAPMLLRDFGYAKVLGWAVPAVLAMVWAVIVGWRRVRPFSGATFPPLRASERDFVCGAALVVGVFFLGASYLYKLVFAVWLLPWLWEETADRAERRWRRLTWGVLLALVWIEGGVATVMNLWAPPISAAQNDLVLKTTLVSAQLLAWGLVVLLLRSLALLVFRQAGALWHSVPPPRPARPR